MNKETINRLKALEASTFTGPMMLRVVDDEGNRFECTLKEYLEHTDTWQWERCLSGVTLEGARKVLDTFDCAF